MNEAKKSYLDTVAVGMALICGVHCLLTPFLLVLIPIVGHTFWVHEDFHTWMLVLVVPTTSVAVLLGCRKHRDRSVLALAALGLGLLALGLPVGHGGERADGGESASCCPAPLAASHPQDDAHLSGNQSELLKAPASFHLGSIALGSEQLLTSLGGLLLAIAHVRNFRLCRLSGCCHGQCE